MAVKYGECTYAVIKNAECTYVVVLEETLCEIVLLPGWRTTSLPTLSRGPRRAQRTATHLLQVLQVLFMPQGCKNSPVIFRHMRASKSTACIEHVSPTLMPDMRGERSAAETSRESRQETAATRMPPTHSCPIHMARGLLLRRRKSLDKKQL